MPTCKTCEQRFGLIELRDGRCKTCRAEYLEGQNSKEAAQQSQLISVGLTADVSPSVLDQKAKEIVLTTGLELPGRSIDSIVSVVASEAAIGMNIIRDIANNFRDTFGGRSGSTQSALREAREACLKELRREAFILGADAVIAIDIDYNEISTSGSGGGILFVAANGTAVKLAPQTSLDNHS